MSKNIIIQEGGTPKSLTVDKLSTALSIGGHMLWVPEEDVQLGTKYINENGTYNAGEDGYYGYSSVTVSGVGVATGKDPDGSGDDAYAITDPESGELVFGKAAETIAVTTPPTKRAYQDGETIDYSGMVVHGYSASGVDLGAIPNNELLLPITTAGAHDKDIWTDGNGINAMQITYTPNVYVGGGGGEIVRYVYSGGLGTYQGNKATYGHSATTMVVSLLVTRYNGQNYAMLVSDYVNWTGLDLYVYTSDDDGDGQYYGWSLAGGASAFAEHGKFKPAPWSDVLTNIPESTVAPGEVDVSTFSVTQSIPVQWHRKGDYKLLETSFTITVDPG